MIATLRMSSLILTLYGALIWNRYVLNTMKKAVRLALFLFASAGLLFPEVTPLAAQAQPQETLVRLLRQHVKYVFVFYQENRSFDSYFGSFPGAAGLFSQPSVATPGFTQTLVDTDGSQTTVTPFRIGPAQFAADTDDIDHSHSLIDAKMDVQYGAPLMDRFALTEERKYSPAGNPSLKAKQFGELAMAYEDCDTVPFLWHWADKFALYDHIFQLMTGPSTPGNLSIIGAQTGETQLALHPGDGYWGVNGDSGAGVPALNDARPFWGSKDDPTPANEKLPFRPADKNTSAIEHNLTYATLPLTLQGKSLPAVTHADRAPKSDLADVREDIAHLGATGLPKPVYWGWYQEGFDREPTDQGPLDAEGNHASYITHHNGPQYFGYISNNPQMRAHLFGIADFFKAVTSRSLPPSGGVLYVKGGAENTFGLKPADPDPVVQKNFTGDDDHPAYSDAQISEAMVAKGIDAIANSPYWSQSAIIITWDDSEGDYDHVVPMQRLSFNGLGRLEDGPRVPFLLISPFARSHTVVHDWGNHASVVKFIDTLFGVEPLATLPDEAHARAAGQKRYGVPNLGPHDADANITDLLGGFDPDRLAGRVPPIPAADAIIPDAAMDPRVQNDGHGCQRDGIVPVDRAQNLPNPIPADFNPRPSTNPGPG